MADPVIASVGATIETRAQAESGPDGEVKFWLQQLDLVEKEERNFVKRGRKIVERFRDERGKNLTDRGVKRYNILWSNVETLKPALYNRTPKPDVERRFKDDDPRGRLASMILERALAYTMDNCDFDAAMESAVEDRLLPGRGIVRIRYIPHYGEAQREKLYLKAADVDASSVESGLADEDEEPTVYTTEDGERVSGNDVKFEPDGRPYKEGESFRPVVYEEVVPEYKFWEDVRISNARNFKESGWVAFREYLTRDELVARFKAAGKVVTLNYTPKGVAEADQAGPQNDAFKKAVVWEIWDKAKRQTIWISTGYDKILDRKEDPLRLEKFFPIPKPLTSTTTTDVQTPVPDYVEYQDQANELDVLTTRIDKLTRALKVAGAYAGEERAILQQLLDEGNENKLVPVDHWAAFAGDKGGLQNLIVWLPIDQIAKVMIGLVDQRDKIKAAIYELTGMADLIRGSTSPDETYGAQRLKSHYYTLRISRPQKQIALFARDIIRLMAEVICSQFSPQTLSMITGLPEQVQIPQLPPAPPAVIAGPAQSNNPPGAPPQMQPNPAMQQYQAAAQAQQAALEEQQKRETDFLAAVEFLRQSTPRPFRIDIEADSTIAPDEDAEKQARTEFLGAVVPLLEQVIPMIRQYPMLAKFGKQMVMFGVRGFRAGRSLEEALEEAFDQLAQLPPEQPQQKGGKGGQDPQVAMAKLGIDQQEAQGKLAIEAQKAQAETQYKEGRLALMARGQAASEAYDSAVIADMARKTMMGTR